MEGSEDAAWNGIDIWIGGGEGSQKRRTWNWQWNDNWFSAQKCCYHHWATTRLAMVKFDWNETGLWSPKQGKQRQSAMKLCWYSWESLMKYIVRWLFFFFVFFFFFTLWILQYLDTLQSQKFVKTNVNRHLACFDSFFEEANSVCIFKPNEGLFLLLMENYFTFAMTT